jgi:nitrogen regulatory protein PII
MYMILCVVHDPEKCQALLDAWKEAGVTGATILHSTGIGRLKGNGMWDDLPLFPGMDDLLEHEEYFNRTIFSILEGDEAVDQVVRATELVLGDLSLPDTGLLAVLPVLRVYGSKKQYQQED